MTADEGRSLSSGISIPQWMKTKITDHRLDIEQTAFSPTELDDNFLYIRYPRASSVPLEQTQSVSIDKKPPLPSTAPVTNTKLDFSKHTPPCQKFIAEANQTSTKPINKPTLSAKLKSNGTDDGFKGEAAACGSSVVKVAHQMVSSKVLKGFNVNPQSDECPQGFDPTIRRGSKSLPASPLSSPKTSPKSNRRINKYFTGTFVENDKYHGSWILSNLLAKRAISQSVGVIAEESKEELHHGASETSLDSVHSTKSAKQVFRPKPSELREMNFWSPTSM